MWTCILVLASAACSPLLRNLKLFIHSSGSSKLYVHAAASWSGELKKGTWVKFQVGKIDRPIAIIYVAFTSCRKNGSRFLLQAFNMQWVSHKGMKPNPKDVNCISLLDASPEEMETAEEVQTQRLCMSAMLVVLQSCWLRRSQNVMMEKPMQGPRPMTLTRQSLRQR